MNAGRAVFAQLLEHLPDQEFHKCVGRYVLVTIVRKRLDLQASLYQILQILSLTVFEKTSILCALEAIELDTNFAENVNQLILFDF